MYSLRLDAEGSDSIDSGHGAQSREVLHSAALTTRKALPRFLSSVFVYDKYLLFFIFFIIKPKFK